MSAHRRAEPGWLPYLDLACAFSAAGLWYVSSRWQPLVLALAPWAIRLALTGRPTRRTPFDLPLALFLLTAALGIWVAFDRQAAWARFWLFVGAVFVFYALANAEPAGNPAEEQARRGGSLRVWFLTLSGVGAAVVFVLTNDWQASASKIGLLTRLGLALQAALPRLPGPDANPNIVGGILAMLLPFAALAAVQAGRGLLGAPRPRPARAWLVPRPAFCAGLALGLALVSLAVVTVGLVFTASRGAWVALLGALALAALWLLADRFSRGSRTRQGYILAAWLGLALLVVLAVAIARPGAIAALLNALPGPSAVGARTELWRNGLTLVSDYPLSGLGLDGFMMAYSTYVMLLHVGFASHAHNLYLDLAIEQGLPALCLFLSMCALFWRRFWRDPLPSEAQQSSQMGAAALSLCVILLHGLIDDPLYKSRAVLFLFVPLAFAGRLSPQQETERQGRSRRAYLAPLLCALILLALALVWRAPLLSRVASNLGTVQQSQVELAEYTWPQWPIQDEVRRHKDLGPAVARFRLALGLDAGNATANRRLGQIELSLGRYEAALQHLQVAYTAEPWNRTTQQLLGEAYLANGRLEEGRALWAGVSNEQAQLDIRVWWYGHIGEKERAAWMRQAAARPPR